MSMHYGYTPETYSGSNSQVIVLPFRVHYKAISKSYSYPYILSSGFPPVRMCGKGWMNEMSAIRILTHLLDNDNTIGDTLRISYELTCIMNDGRTEKVKLKDIDMVHKRLGTLHPNMFIIEETFVISKFISDYKNIVLMTIGFEQLDNATYGNESVLEVVSIHTYTS